MNGSEPCFKTVASSDFSFFCGSGDKLGTFSLLGQLAHPGHQSQYQTLKVDCDDKVSCNINVIVENQQHDQVLFCFVLEDW